ncbi:MAG: DNA mismatch endonuclease Vsr [Candidatus Angelobacter sp.]
MDRISRCKRSENMRRIRSRNTIPELQVRSLLHRLGFRFRLHYSHLPGRPDIVFPSRSKVIFVHGCFWHQHAHCIDCHVPKSNSSYWLAKLTANRNRDRRNRARLRRLGWKYEVIWECEAHDTERLARRLLKFLKRS